MFEHILCGWDDYRLYYYIGPWKMADFILQFDSLIDPKVALSIIWLAMLFNQIYIEKCFNDDLF